MRTSLKKVLVVDDDPVVGKSFDRVLSEKGYAVSTALNGREALNKLGCEDYDVVFTDIKMPGMDGIEVAERIRERRPWIPVVIITGYGTAANEARAEAVGVSEFLRKPLSPDMIEGSARKALRVIEGSARPALLEKAATAAPEKGIDAAIRLQPAAVAKESPSKNIALFLKNIALLFAAPFVGLAYVIASPFIGLAMLAWMGVGALVKRAKTIAFLANTARSLKNVALFFAAPFVGLAYVIAFPFVGLGMLLWWGARALVKRSGSD